MSNYDPAAGITITVNGTAREIPPGLTVETLLGHLGVDARRVAVELNRRIVRQVDWPAAAVEPGSEIEIVEFVGGGRPGSHQNKNDRLCLDHG